MRGDFSVCGGPIKMGGPSVCRLLRVLVLGSPCMWGSLCVWTMGSLYVYGGPSGLGS